MKLLVIPLLLLTSACLRFGEEDRRPVETDSVVCEGLKDPIEDYVQAVKDNIEKTPTPVLVTGAGVVKVYDVGCGK